MTWIAHLSDLHLLERDHDERRTTERLKLSFLSFGRPLDAEERRARVRAALWAYQCSDAEHLVITGDLTEDGTPAQFEVLAEVLLGSAIDPREITLVPGNHDGYQTSSAFARALAGPLAPFAATSRPDALTVLDAIAIAPVWTVIDQPVTRSAGMFPHEQIGRIRALAKGFGESGRAIVIAQHHPPHAHALPGYNWIDGLQNHAAAMALLEQDRKLHVLHGHRHRKSDRAVSDNGWARVFGTTACVDHAEPLRIYEAGDRRLWPIATPDLPRRPNAVRVSPALNPAWAD